MKVRELSALELAALKVRQRAAAEELFNPESRIPPWRLLVVVVAPSEAVQLASEKRAQQILAERAA